MDIPSEQIRGRSRSVGIVAARQVAMWAIHQRMRLSSVQIGDFFERDQTTVMHAMRRVENDPQLRAIAEQAITNKARELCRI